MKETFDITGRGVAVAVEGPTGLPVGKRLSATITTPDGAELVAFAYKEWLLRRATPATEDEAFLLIGLSKSHVPVGSHLRLELNDDP